MAKNITTFEDYIKNLSEFPKRFIDEDAANKIISNLKCKIHHKSPTAKIENGKIIIMGCCDEINKLAIYELSKLI
ncbi:MAG: hypothetical protein WC389_17550 [Lutibacter sp.]|jgi:hypothetical protein